MRPQRQCGFFGEDDGGVVEVDDAAGETEADEAVAPAAAFLCGWIRDDCVSSFGACEASLSGGEMVCDGVGGGSAGFGVA